MPENRDWADDVFVCDTFPMNVFGEIPDVSPKAEGLVDIINRALFEVG